MESEGKGKGKVRELRQPLCCLQNKKYRIKNQKIGNILLLRGLYIRSMITAKSYLTLDSSESHLNILTSYSSASCNRKLYSSALSA